MTLHYVSDALGLDRVSCVHHIISEHAERRPDAVACAFSSGPDRPETQMTYAGLHAMAEAIAGHLLRLRLRDRPVLILLPAGLEYVQAFFGCQYAGVIAVPAYPFDAQHFASSGARLSRIAQDARASHAIVTREMAHMVHEREEELTLLGLGDVTWLPVEDLLTGDDAPVPGWAEPSRISFLQYTSGSTGDPKGVIVSHENVLANLRSIDRALRLQEDSGFVSWLPPYHDMGLIGGILTPLSAGTTTTLMSSMTFVRHPEHWLECLARTRAQTSVSPNFGFEHCITRLATKDLSHLDLSSWRQVLNGAEPVRSSTLQRFAELLRPAGFRPEDSVPCYGLAEATLMVTGQTTDTVPRVLHLDRAALAAGTVQHSPDGSPVVSCGAPIPGMKVAIVDPERREACPAGRLGEIWVQGRSVARGYWRRPEAADTFTARAAGLDGEYLRTGDVGFLDDGELFITGRIKDVINIQGRNLFPPDIEEQLEATAPALRAGRGAVFSVDLADREELVVCYEADTRRTPAPELLADIRATLKHVFDVAPFAVLLLRRGTIPRTTSGKIQRAICAREFTQLRLKVEHASVLDIPTDAHSDSLPDSADPTAGPPTDLLSVLGITIHDLLSLPGPALADIFRTPTRATLDATRPEASAAHAATAGPRPEAAATADPAVQAWLVTTVAQYLGLPPTTIDPTRPLADQGLDSRSLVELCRRATEHFGVTLEPSDVYAHPTVTALATFLSAGTARAASTRSALGDTPDSDRRADVSGSPTPRAAADGPSARHSGVAVLGLSCAMPGAPDADAYWRLLLDARCAVQPAATRALGTVERAAAYLDDIADFDPLFFGITTHEASLMDPQQRLVLHHTWRALEDAGINPASLAGSNTGVFVGASSNDYAARLSRAGTPPQMYRVTGNSHAVLANRVSYQLDLRGPSLAIDTACSSSLAALHQARLALDAGECDLAVVAAVNVLLDEEVFDSLAGGHMLSPTGRPQGFADGADGYVRGEGVGVVVLARAAAAPRPGTRVRAVVRGSAIAHSGRTNGLTAPHPARQEELIRTALADAGLQSQDIDHVEAHGTGTPLGDPVEITALAHVYGTGRGGWASCGVSTAKNAVGHLEAAAGMAGLVKAVLSLEKGVLPALAGDVTPTRRVDWDESGLHLTTRTESLPTDRPARIAVSSFGFGGLNAHVIVESAPASAPASTPERPAYTVVLSAPSDTSLRDAARELRADLAGRARCDLGPLAATLSTARLACAHRAALIIDTRASLDHGLAALAAGKDHPDVLVGTAQPTASPIFLFSGQGTFDCDVVEALVADLPVFTASFHRYAAVLQDYGVDVLGRLRAADAKEAFRETDLQQPALVAMQLALVDTWAALGIEPAAVLGHSIGSLSAAAVSGALTAEEALGLAARRGRIMASLPGAGAMAVCIGDADVIDERAAFAPGVTVAAYNSEDQLVISGERDQVQALAADLETTGVRVHPLPVSHAFHSPLMNAGQDELRRAAADLRPVAPRLPWMSEASVEWMGAPDPHYWARHLVQPVRFLEALRGVTGAMPGPVIEIGCGAGLAAICRRTLSHERIVLPSTSAARPYAAFVSSASRLFVAGAPVDLAALEVTRPAPVPCPGTVMDPHPVWFTDGSTTPSPERSVTETVTETVNMTMPVPAPETVPAPTPVRAPESDDATATALRRHLSAITGHPAERISRSASLRRDLGMDSLMLMTLRQRLGLDDEAGRQLAAALDRHDSVDAVIALLDAGTLAPQPGPVPDATTRPTAAAEPAAVENRVEPLPAPLPASASPVEPLGPDITGWPEYRELQARLEQAQRHGHNPYGRTHDGFNGPRTTVDGVDVVSFSAFNYLCLSNHPCVIDAAVAATQRYGTSCSATPLLNGETPEHRTLDAAVARLVGTEAAIVFGSGHATNVATVGHLFAAGDLVIHDEWIHDSTVRGAMLSGATRRSFPHNDWQALDRILTDVRGSFRRVVVVIEGAYSQDGDIPDLPRFIQVKKAHNALLMVDEAHSIGVLGATGRGIGEHFGVSREDVDLWMGTLSKALGSVGGYIAGRAPLIEYLKYTAPLFIFSTGLSPAGAAAARAAIEVLESEPARVSRLQELSDHFRAAARARSLDVGVSRSTAVIPVIVGDWDRAIELSARLLEEGINVMPIGYPAVPADACRLRFFVNVDHTTQEIDAALDTLARLMADRPPHDAPAPARVSPLTGTVLVVGANGFIGQHVVADLARHGTTVRAVVRSDAAAAALASIPNVTRCAADLRDPASLRSALDGVDAVVNCAGLSADWGSWADFRAINVTGSRALAEACADAGVRRLVHLSTTDVFGYPATWHDAHDGHDDLPLVDTGLPYNRSKLMGEDAVRRVAQERDLDLTVVRPVSVFGPGSKDFVVEIVSLLKGRQMVRLGSGDTPAGLLYVEDLAAYITRVLADPRTIGKTYTLRDPHLTTWEEYVTDLAAGLGLPGPRLHLGRKSALRAARTLERVHRVARLSGRPLLTRHAVNLFTRDQAYPIGATLRDLPIDRTPYEEAMRRTLAWCRESGIAGGTS